MPTTVSPCHLCSGTMIMLQTTCRVFSIYRLVSKCIYRYMYFFIHSITQGHGYLGKRRKALIADYLGSV